MSHEDFDFDLPEVNGTDDAPSDPRHKALRDLFVSEYLIDFTPLVAAQRCGFSYELAKQWSTKLMQEPYVQRRINELQFVKTDPAKAKEYNTIRIRQRLMYEAHNTGPGSSQAARVAALKALAEIEGMSGAKADSGAPGVAQGGVMAVPGIASLSDWEQAATKSQQQLVTDARK